MKVDHIKLDESNAEFNNAAELVKHTNKPVYLTGKAGTGKTTFLKYIKSTTEKNTVVLAPTGVAAINAGGVTIHSFFQLPFGPFVPHDTRLRTKAADGKRKETIYTTFRYREEKQKIIKNLELLIIDEISMVRADTLDVIDKILRAFRKSILPFGGVQVVLIGDTFQLPPIVQGQEHSILSQFYKTPFFFSSKVIKHNKPLYIELKKIYRQNEQEFIDLLNRVRINNLSQSDYNRLNTRYNPSFSGNGDDYIILATHNKIVNQTNLNKLKQLDTKPFTFEANVTGTFPEKHKPTDHFLKLKVGAQVMFVRNDTGDSKRYYNGKIGKIKKLEKNTITTVFDDGTEVDVEPVVWDNIQYSYNKEKMRVEEETIGTFKQFPIRLAWAITIHKSQGLTFEKIIADLGNAFVPGQVYVALSRCTSFNGLQLRTRLNQRAIKTDPRVLEFAKNETPATLITEQLNTGKADSYYRKARDEFSKGNIRSSFDSFKRALKFRNDINTDSFERFLIIKSKRLYDYRAKFNDTLKTNQLFREKILKTERACDQLMLENSGKMQQIENLSSSIEVLRDKINKLENQHKKLEVENQQDKAEIERLKKLKWYQKLMGKE